MASSTITGAALRSILTSVVLIIYSLSPSSLAQNGDSPLSGTKHQHPLSPTWLVYQHPDLARLLDVGACLGPSNDTSISYIPPLDGTDPLSTLCLDNYSMNFVLFDLELVNMKTVDAIGGSFTAKLQMVLHWFDAIGPGSNGAYIDPAAQHLNCSFLCDTSSAASLCCDDIWVPPLRLPGCTINAIQSITPTPYIYFLPTNFSSTSECFYVTNKYQCDWRRLWYLNIDVTCAVDMNFHHFPFDLQELNIDVLNPYASRTWFQLNRGFLKNNVGEGINGVNLTPDKKISGWYIKDLMVSSTCGIQQTWQQTFLAQNDLLLKLSDQKEQKAYTSQQQNIRDALDPANLQCATMQSLSVKDVADFSNPTNTQPYDTTVNDYTARAEATLNRYRDCVQRHGRDYYLNNSISNYNFPRGGGSFSLSEENINRSFGLLDLTKKQPTKVWFPCAIEAVANLTTGGIRITILVQRYRIFYMVKLILPTIACGAFAFSTFGLQPSDLMGRLTVVVPSAIALTALQGLVVATDIPAVAYIAPTTYIILVTYFAQILIAFESIVVNRWYKQRQGEIGRSPNKLGGSLRGAHEMNKVSTSSSERVIELPRRNISSQNEAEDQTSNQDELPILLQDELPPINSSTKDGGPTILQPQHPTQARKLDLRLMVVLTLLYILGIALCICIPWLSPQKDIQGGGVSMWPSP